MDKFYYYTLYGVTNLINGKWYVGSHRTTNIHDDYLGSGVAINRAIRKYGRENFVKTVFSFGLDEADMYRLEAEWVTEKVINDRRFYNIVPGGNMPPKGTSESGRKSYQTRIKQGNPLIGPKATSESGRKGHKTAVERGTYKKPPKATSENGHKAHATAIRRGTYHKPPVTTSETARKIVENKKKKGTYYATCEHCGKRGQKTAMTLYHFNNCKFKEKKDE